MSDRPEHSRLLEIAETAIDGVSRYRRQIRIFALWLSAPLFLGTLLLSLHTNPTIFSDLYWPALIALLVLSLPAGVLLGAVDFKLLALCSGTNFTYRSCLETVLVSNAANLLPIPGSLAVRIGALQARGVPLTVSGGISLLFSAAWLSTGLLFAGATLLFSVRPPVALSLLLAGFVGLWVSTWLGMTKSIAWRLMLRVLAIRAGFVICDAASLALAFHSLQVNVSYSESLVLSLSSSLSSLVPAGVGVKETLAAGLGVLIGVGGSAAFLASALQRIAGFVVLSAGSLVILLIERALPKRN